MAVLQWCITFVRQTTHMKKEKIVNARTMMYICEIFDHNAGGVSVSLHKKAAKTRGKVGKAANKMLNQMLTDSATNILN